MDRSPVSRDASAADTVAASADYRALIERLKARVRESQARVARTVNRELVMLYWSIGREIVQQQKVSGWGDDVVGRISADLTADMGGARGFSRRNLFYMRRLAVLWPEPEKVQPLAALIGWTHHQVLLDAFSDRPDLYEWYAAKASEHRWSRRHLAGQIHLRLHDREGAALTNFSAALEPADADRALQAIKDPYVFDFLDLAESAHERELEQALIDDIQRFLLELGTGSRSTGAEGVAGRRAVPHRRRPRERRHHPGGRLVAKLALHRVYAPIAVSTWRTDRPAPALPPVEVTEDVPADFGELAELDEVRARLVERVAHHQAPRADDARPD